MFLASPKSLPLSSTISNLPKISLNKDRYLKSTEKSDLGVCLTKLYSFFTLIKMLQATSVPEKCGSETQKREEKTSPVVREGMKGFCLYNDVVRTDLITKAKLFQQKLPAMKEAKGAKNVLLFTSLSLFFLALGSFLYS